MCRTSLLPTPPLPAQICSISLFNVVCQLTNVTEPCASKFRPDLLGLRVFSAFTACAVFTAFTV
jgi:hypothetical protein